MTEPTARPSAALASCPLLGLPDDPQTHYAYTNGAHRCHSRARPMAIDVDHQARFCLTDGYPDCKRYERWVREGAATTRPAVPTGRVLEVAAATSPVGAWATGPRRRARRGRGALVLLTVVLAIAALAVGAVVLRPGAPPGQAALPSATATVVAGSVSASPRATIPTPSVGPASPSATSAPTSSAAPSSAPPGSSEPARRVHVVQAGEWLSTIAAQYGTTVEELLDLNDIPDRDVIEIGQEIVLPSTSRP